MSAVTFNTITGYDTNPAKPEATTASSTIQLPMTPVDGQIHSYAATLNITTPQVSSMAGHAVSGAPLGSVGAGQVIQYKFSQASRSWTRLQ
jgi:hypothetical protein